MSDDRRQLHVLGAFVHGMLFGLHALGFVYNVRRRNRLDVVVHAGAAAYDLWATVKHAKEVQR